MSVCLDAWAVLAWLDGDEPAHTRVEEVLESRPVMSWVNAVEVYYRVERDNGRPAADDVLAQLRTLVDLDLPGVSLMVDTARLKSKLPISLADCFAVATASAFGLTLLTGDPEIIELTGPSVGIEDLR